MFDFNSTMVQMSLLGITYIFGYGSILAVIVFIVCIIYFKDLIAIFTAAHESALTSHNGMFDFNSTMVQMSLLQYLRSKFSVDDLPYTAHTH